SDWNSEDNRAVWTIEPSKAGKYAVWLDYACSDQSAGNKFLLEAGGQRLTDVVAGTGGWSNYKQSKVGEIELAAGKQQVTLRSAGKLNGALLELRAIRLVPAFEK